MKVCLKKGELREAVTGLGRIISRRSTLPVLGCVRFEAGRAGVTAQATNLEQTAGYRFRKATAEGTGSCILPLGHLKDLAKGNVNDPVEFETRDSSIAVTNTIGGHAIRQVVLGIDPEEWPSMPGDVPTRPAGGFLEIYRRLLPFASVDPTRMVLNGVYIDTNGKGRNPVTMVATDGRRLTAVNSLRLPVDKPVILPNTKFLASLRVDVDPEIGVCRAGENTTLFGLTAGPWVYAARAIDGAYPNYRQVIPSGKPSRRFVFTDEAVSLLRGVLPTFPGGDEIVLIGDDNQVRLYGRGPDDEHWTSLPLEGAVYEGERAVIGVNRHYLLDALGAGFRTFAFEDSTSPLVSRDDQGGLHVLMPITATDPESGEDQPEDPETADDPQDVDTPQEDAPEAPAPERKPPETKGEKTMPRPKREPNGNNTPESALDRALAAYEQAREKMRELQAAILTAAGELKTALREQKTQAKEMESARTALSKLQSINL